MNLVDVGRTYTGDGGRTAVVTVVRHVEGIGMCVRADVRSANRKDTRRHLWAGRIGPFIKAWSTQRA